MESSAGRRRRQGKRLMKERQQGRERWGLMFREDTRVKGCGDRQWNIGEKEVVRERESKRVIHGPREIYNTGNKPIGPPTKDRWSTFDSMLFQSKAMKTITVSMPNQECIGCKLMCVGTAAKCEQQRMNCRRKEHLCTAARGWTVQCIHIGKQ